MVVEVGGGMVDGESFLVVLVYFGEYVNLGFGFYIVVGLDV